MPVAIPTDIRSVTPPLADPDPADPVDRPLHLPGGSGRPRRMAGPVEQQQQRVASPLQQARSPVVRLVEQRHEDAVERVAQDLGADLPAAGQALGQRREPGDVDEGERAVTREVASSSASVARSTRSGSRGTYGFSSSPCPSNSRSSTDMVSSHPPNASKFAAAQIEYAFTKLVGPASRRTNGRISIESVRRAGSRVVSSRCTTERMDAHRQKQLVLILARQFAANLSTPTLIADARGYLVFYNEAAEAAVGRPFAEAGEMPFNEWLDVFEARTTSSEPLRPEERPTRIAFNERRPSHLEYLGHERGRSRARDRGDGVSALRATDEFVGIVAIFWRN